MQFIERLRSRIRPERVRNKTPDNWSYLHFKEYLLAISQNPDFLLESGQYPKRIELSSDWHEALGQVSMHSLDGYERLALIGVKADRRSLYLPTIPAKGLTDQVPTQVQMAERQRAISNFKLQKFVGDIHSHPIPSPAIFSAGDLFSLVHQPPELMTGIVQGRENLFAFRSRESTNTGLNDDVFNQESFERFWYEQHGFKYLGFEHGAFRAYPISKRANQWHVNLDIAGKHNLVLYRGQAGRDLLKVFPSNRK